MAVNILHLGIVEEQFYLWGEKTPNGVDETLQKYRRKSRSFSPALPFGATVADLVNGLMAANVNHSFTKNEKVEIAVWLPTRSGRPLASSVLIAEPPTGRGKLAFAPWGVAAIRLSVSDAIDLLCATIDKPTLAPGLVVGADVAYWSIAMQYAAGLVARQQFLPSIREVGDKFFAEWAPVIDGQDISYVMEFAQRMPGVTRAMSPVAASEVPAEPAEKMLRCFLARIVDALVRNAVQRDERQLLARRGSGKKRHTFDSVHDAWLAALRPANAEIEGEPRELKDFSGQIALWQRPVTMTSAAPVRLCFRLEEPAPTVDENTPVAAARKSKNKRPDPWHVRYLLQARDDPSLLVPVEKVWNGHGGKTKAIRMLGPGTQEYLLSSLGQASGICPRIEKSLKFSHPTGYETNATGAFEFLTQKAAALQQAGFAVMLPAWWTGKGTKLKMTTKAKLSSPKLSGSGALSLDQLVRFEWQVALGNQVLSEEELAALASLKQPLVNIRGQWVQLSPEEIQAAIDVWKRKAENTATVREVVQLALGAGDGTRTVAVAGVDADGWIGQLLDQLQGKAEFAECEPAPGFIGQLRPYQQRGYSWLAFLRRWGLGACLADDMGLGKTVQTLALIERDWNNDSRRPVLLICPTSVVGNWQKEAARFTPDLPVMVHHGVTRAKDAAFRKDARRQAIVISSYALLHRDFDHLAKVDWAGVILDEAQNIKNPETKQARAARALRADYRIALTGTPVENHVGDLWSIMQFLNPGLLGTQAEFKRSFFIPIQAQRDTEAAERLKRITGPFMLRRLKTDKSIIADLPEKMEMKVYCNLTKEQASLYAAVLKEAEKTLNNSEGIQRKGLILGMLSKLKQVCNHPAHFLGDNSSIPDRSGKLSRLTEMIEELLEAGDRTLVFTQFTEMGDILHRYLQENFGREVLFLHGGVTKRNRDAMVERFQSADGPAVFLLSLKAGGTGLNLTSANHVFHFDRWWNPAVENQATDRAFRIGQTRNVQVHKFICVGTFEERIDEMIESKKEISEKVVGAGEGWLTELSNKQLRELFSLRKDAVGV